MGAGHSGLGDLAAVANGGGNDFGSIAVVLQHCGDLGDQRRGCIAVLFFPAEERTDEGGAGPRGLPGLRDGKDQRGVDPNALAGQLSNRFESLFADTHFNHKVGRDPRQFQTLGDDLLPISEMRIDLDTDGLVGPGEQSGNLLDDGSERLAGISHVAGIGRDAVDVPQFEGVTDFICFRAV